METIKIFIASSAELEQDRKEFRDFLSVENDRLHTNNAYLKLEQWEYFQNTVSQTNLQDEYNKALKECAIVICLFYTKAGKYTQLEFDTALKQFHDTGSPLIYTYFKTGAPEPDPTNEQSQDLIKFKKRLSEIGHFYTRYDSITDLKLQFKLQLDLLAEKGLIKLQQDVKEATKEAVANYLNTITIHADNQRAEKIGNIGTVNGNVSF